MIFTAGFSDDSDNRPMQFTSVTLENAQMMEPDRPLPGKRFQALSNSPAMINCRTCVVPAPISISLPAR
jgi:hypothetical protein